ncbi:hypothetical protein HK102_009634, partial [Quaeritorhiza haematococci]
FKSAASAASPAPSPALRLSLPSPAPSPSPLFKAKLSTPSSVALQKIARIYSQHGYPTFPVKIWGDRLEEQPDGSMKLKKGCLFPIWNALSLEQMNALSFYDRNGIAILTGHRSGLTVVEVDNLETWEELLGLADELEPETVRARSQSGGIHLYFKYSPDLPTDSNVFPGIDIRNDKNGCIFAPPSAFVFEGEKREYAWYPGFSLIDNRDKLLVILDWLLRVLHQRLAEKKGNVNTNNYNNHNNHNNHNNKRSSELVLRSSKKLKSEDDEFDDREHTMINRRDPIKPTEVRKLTRKLNAQRADDYSLWRDVGFAIHHSTCGSDKGLQIFDEFSRRCRIKYDEYAVADFWRRIKDDSEYPPTFGSLKAWAKQDNPEKGDGVLSETTLGIVGDKLYKTFEKIKVLLEDIGFCEVTMKEQCPFGFEFFADIFDDDDRCPACQHRAHDGNIYRVEEPFQDLVVVRNTHHECKTLIYGLEKHKLFKRLIT